MRYLLPIFFALTLSLTGCVEEEPQCPDEEDTTCTCEDGSEGEFVCSDGAVDCICHGQSDGNDEDDEDDD